mgnify:CR=1 FL=1
MKQKFGIEITTKDRHKDDIKIEEWLTETLKHHGIQSVYFSSNETGIYSFGDKHIGEIIIDSAEKFTSGQLQSFMVCDDCFTNVIIKSEIE